MESLRYTLLKRPDLIHEQDLFKEEKAFLDNIKNK